MSSRQTSGKEPGGKTRRFALLVGLLAFLPYLLLPAAYFAHLAAFPLPAASGDLTTGSPIMASQAGEPVSPHDSNTCYICRGASHLQDYGTSLVFHAPDGNSLGGCLADGYCFSGFARADVHTGYTRAPPVVFPAPFTV